MFDRIELFRMAQAMAVHAGARQGVVAENVANADTPGFRARDIAPFAEAWRAADAPLRTTRAGHLGGGSAMAFAPRDAGGEASPNGNNVSIETEMVRAAEIRGQHDRALAIYRSGLSILRATLGR